MRGALVQDAPHVGDGAEQRKYARIEADVPCSVATSTDAFEARAANLSRSGAGVVGPDGLARTGETVTVMLERGGELPPLAMAGKVVRQVPRGGQVLYGVQFAPMPPEQETELVELLQQLSGGKGVGRREHPRVAARIAVNCRSEDIFRGFLNDLSKGGMSVKTLRDVEPGHRLSVSFGMPNHKGLVEIAGEVVSSQKLEHGFRIGVRFESFSDADRAKVEALLDQLLGINLPDAEIVEDD